MLTTHLGIAHKVKIQFNLHVKLPRFKNLCYAWANHKFTTNFYRIIGF